MKTLRMRIAAVATTAAVLAGSAGVAMVSAATGGATVTLASTSGTSTHMSSIPVTATFSSSVTGLATSSINVTNGTVSSFSGSGDSYSFSIMPSAEGAVTVQIPADVANNASSTGNQASNVLTFTYDTTQPTISGINVTGITDACATIGWTTNESASGSIAYGSSMSYGSTATTSASTTSSKQICGLAASTTYNYQISATDAAGNMATTSNQTFATLASSATSSAPVISNPTVTVMGTSSVKISWNTDVAATGFVSYGTSTSYGTDTSTETTASTTHSVTLNGLQEATMYHYRISQMNAFGTTTSNDATFFTSSTGSTTPLALISTEGVRTTAVADGTFENGFKWVLTFTVPDNETNFQMRFTDFTSGSNTIAAANNIRVYSSQSSNATSSASAITATNNEYGAVMQLTGDSATSTPGRQVKVTVEVRVPFGTAPASNYTTTFGVRTAVPTP